MLVFGGEDTSFVTKETKPAPAQRFYCWIGCDDTISYRTMVEALKAEGIKIDKEREDCQLVYAYLTLAQIAPLAGRHMMSGYAHHLVTPTDAPS